MDRSGDTLGRCVCVGRRDMRKSLHALGGYELWSRFLARLDSPPYDIALRHTVYSRHLGHRNPRTSTDTPLVRVRSLGDGSEIFAAR